jgi:fucose permease
MIIAGGTIVSSLFSDRSVRKFGAGLVTLISVSMTAAALLGFSYSRSFAALCLFAVPLGLGAGSVDAALNNFVALHYKARHMSWLHCFWGVGASTGPVVMAYCLTHWNSWNAGYRAISIIQFTLSAVLLFSLPLWKVSHEPPGGETNPRQKSLKISQLVKLPGAKPALAAFFCYCAIESTVGLWGSSYLAVMRNVPAETAARWISLFYLGITLGRFFSGFLAIKIAHGRMVRLGQLLIGAGVLLVAVPTYGASLMAGLFVVGLGCAPIYPSLLHQTPENFGNEHSQAIMGVQMACAYVGTTFAPPLFGFLGAKTSYGLFPFFVAGLLVLMAAMVTLLYRGKMAAG